MTDMEKFTRLFKAVCEDRATRSLLMNQPAACFRQFNLTLPTNVEFKSVEDCMHAPNCVHITVQGAGSLCVLAYNAAEC